MRAPGSPGGGRARVPSWSSMSSLSPRERSRHCLRRSSPRAPTARAPLRARRARRRHAAHQHGHDCRGGCAPARSTCARSCWRRASSRIRCLWPFSGRLGFQPDGDRGCWRSSRSARFLLASRGGLTVGYAAVNMITVLSAALFFGRRGAAAGLATVLGLHLLAWALVSAELVPPVSIDMWDPRCRPSGCAHTIILAFLGLVVAALELYVVEQLAHQVQVHRELAAREQRSAARARTRRARSRARTRAARARAARARPGAAARSAGAHVRRHRARLQQRAHRDHRHRRRGPAEPVVAGRRGRLSRRNRAGRQARRAAHDPAAHARPRPDRLARRRWT